MLEQCAVGSVDGEVEGAAHESPLAFMDVVVVSVAQQDQVADGGRRTSADSRSTMSDYADVASTARGRPSAERSSGKMRKYDRHST